MAFIGRVLRIAVYAFLTWLALAALWLGLPSPSREYRSQPGRYERETLRVSKPLLRIYDIGDFFPYPHGLEGVFFTGGVTRRSFALGYRLEQQRNTTLLMLTDGLTIDLSPEYVTTYPSVSQEKYTVVRTGDQDGINPVWFSVADSTLLYWWIHRDTAKISVKVRWASATIVEVWPSTVRWDRGAREEVQPLIVLKFKKAPGNGPNQMGLLDEVTMPVGSESPSRTYAIRVLILGIIAPTGLLVLGTVNMVGPIFRASFDVIMFLIKMLGVYCAVVAFLWAVRGRRPLEQDQLVSRFPGMGIFGARGAGSHRSRGRRMVWGATGPIEVDDEDYVRTRRRPIRSFADFFQSSAPLDDLLATFESTRHLTEPVGWGDRSSYQRTASRVETVPTAGYERHRKVYSEDGLDESGLIDLEKAMPEKPNIVRMK